MIPLPLTIWDLLLLPILLYWNLQCRYDLAFAYTKLTKWGLIDIHHSICQAMLCASLGLIKGRALCQAVPWILLDKSALLIKHVFIEKISERPDVQ